MIDKLFLVLLSFLVGFLVGGFVIWTCWQRTVKEALKELKK